MDYKDKLTAEIEGRTWTPQPRPPRQPRSATPQQNTLSSSQGPSSQPLSRASSTSSFQTANQKGRNETYFASLGSTNAARPEGIPPNQGGRYTGFGSTPTPPPPAASQAGGLSVDDFTSDPLGTLSKGWSMFSRAAVKTATNINENYVQPGVAKVPSLPSLFLTQCSSCPVILLFV